MEADSIGTKELTVYVQENGIIRRKDNDYLIGRLAEDVTYESLPDESKGKAENKE